MIPGLNPGCQEAAALLVSLVHGGWQNTHHGRPAVNEDNAVLQLSPRHQHQQVQWQAQQPQTHQLAHPT